MKCLRTRILTFLSPAILRSTVESTASVLLVAGFLSVLLGATPHTTIQFRLFPGPRLVGTRADRSGAGTVTAVLDGSKLTLKGSFSGLLAVPTAAHLAMDVPYRRSFDARFWHLNAKVSKSCGSRFADGMRSWSTKKMNASVNEPATSCATGLLP